MMLKDSQLVIMAGGIGSRFWPMSTPEYPKQFLDILGIGKSLLQLTVERFRNSIDVRNIWVVTSRKYIDIVKEQLPEIDAEQILSEPCMRNTAPCISYAAWKIKKKYGNVSMVISPADHIVIDVSKFDEIIRQGLAFVSGSSRILTLGIVPTRPETGYGYIKSSGISEAGDPVCVESFKEKPDYETAKKYFETKGYYWNAGIFLWQTDTILDEIRKNEPEMAELFESAVPYLCTDGEQDFINSIYPECKNISIDYAVMEKTCNAYVIPSSFGWSDLGTWGSLHERLSHDKNDNTSVGGNVKFVDCSGCIARMPANKKVVIQGLAGYIIAEKDDTLLICRLEEEQRIKEFSKY